MRASEAGDWIDRESLRVPSHVVYRPFPHETVALNLETGSYDGLNAAAGEMLDLLQVLGRPDDVAREFSERRELPFEEVQVDVRRLCHDLLDRGLLELDARPAAAHPENGHRGP